MHQLPQLLGAALLLAAYVLSQTRRIRSDSLSYLVLNFLGALLLFIDAVRAVQWGFIILEGTWALITVPGLFSSLSRRGTGGA